MTKEEINVFSKRITQGSRSELVVVTYDIILNYVETAIEAFEDEDMDRYIFNIQKAKQFLNELSSVLDFSYAISRDLMSIYMYVDRCFISCIVKKQMCELDTVISIMGKLRYAFEEVSKSDKNGPVMKNGEQVYAGLTYGKGTLNEVIVRKNIYN